MARAVRRAELWRTAGVLALWWLWLPVGALLVWLVKHFLFGGFGQQDQSYLLFLQSQLFPHGGPVQATVLFWIWVSIGLLGSLLILLNLLLDTEVRRWHRHLVVWTTTAALLASIGCTVTAFWDNDKDEGRYYSSATVLDIPAAAGDAPASARPLTKDARKGDGKRCDYLGAADVPACVKVEPMPDFGFEPRTASYAAASTALRTGSGLASGVSLMGHSVHYLPGTGTGGGSNAATGHGVWTALLDGSGSQPAEGVAVWDGTSNTNGACEFKGDHAFDRAFGGNRANSLRNLLAERFPRLVYQDQDIWGYCDGPDLATARPTVVIAVTRQIAWQHRTVLRPDGVLVLTGSPSGRPEIVHRSTVRPGELPGTVYPGSIVKEQISAVQWLAGRGVKNRDGFGFAHTSTDTNATNPGEYLLRSATDGHFYYVTPLVPRNSSSEAIVAFAVLRADEVGAGLNDLHVYVQSDTSKPTNLTELSSRMVAWIAQQTSVTVTTGAGGELQEIIPFGQGMWRGFVDINGQTQDYIDVSGDGRTTPNLVYLKPSSPSGQPSPGSTPAPSPAPPATAAPSPVPSSTTGCGGDPAALSTAQLASCVSSLSSALASRLQATPTG
ncbi:hypothetical protein [Saccharothrix sp. ST-888]|uniref:hypothetical protein n=1 Tax=Saccharothrix sp. ST-888 TaxID=1427391 RepID=UPI0006975099|nr:hypothetical protein [Saccharothrix sp. ST-888]